jgi:predicted ATPase/class 3 adenylate cyclase
MRSGGRPSRIVDAEGAPAGRPPGDPLGPQRRAGDVLVYWRVVNGGGMVSGRPTGTATFLFTDVEGSTRLWEEHPEAMSSALSRHETILREAVATNGGQVVKSTGDGILAVFTTALAALRAAADMQRTSSAGSWAETGPLPFRVGIHTGTAIERDGDYYGGVVNRAARITAIAHGGQIVTSQATEKLVANDLPPGIGIVDLGEHGLRDLSRAERVFQIMVPDLRSDFPPLRSLHAPQSNLPAQSTSFVGRGVELTAVAAALRDARLMTVTGFGGIGKTRLAVQLAADVLHRFPHGVWFCELASASDRDDLIRQIAAPLGVRLRAGTTLEDSVLEYLTAQRLLLVLDNCEHLLEPLAQIVDDVLRRCPGVRILATSREALSVDGEHVWRLAPLPVPAPLEIDDVGATDAVQLFVERARSVASAFTLDPSNAAAVAAICRHLDGIPLAIELASARVVAMSPDDIAAHLDQRFRLLTGGRRTATDRHQTLRGVVDWSYALLTPAEQTVLARLGVFADDFDARAAEAVVTGEDVGRWDALDALEGLVAKSMVMVDHSPAGATRYKLLETLRHYALERLDEVAGTDERRRRHGEWYVALAEQAEPGLEGTDEILWRHRIEVELANLRDTVGWFLKSDPPLAYRVLAALCYMGVTDLSSGIAAWAGSAAGEVDTAASGDGAAVLIAAAWDAYARGDYAQARRWALDAIGAAAKDRPASCLPFACLHVIDVQEGRASDAMDGMVNATSIVDASGACDRERADVRAFTTFCAVAAGDGPRAAENADEATRLARRSGSPSARAHALAMLGHSLAQDDPDTALAVLDESIELTRAGASDFAFGTALRLGAQLRSRFDEAARALTPLHDSIAHDRARGTRPPLLATLDVTLRVLADLGFAEQAAVLIGVVTTGPLAPLVAERLASGEQDARVRRRLEGELGRDVYEMAVARGAAMFYDDAVEYVLQELDRIIAETSDG